MRTLIAFLPRDAAANALESTVDSRLLVFAFLVSVAAGILSGFAPALQAGRGSLIKSLRERGGTAFGGVRLRKAIVTVQIAFTLILVIGAALFVRTLNGLMAKGPGFATSSLVSFGLDPVRNGYSRAEASQLIRRLDAELRVSGSTEASAVARFQLLTGGSWNDPMTIQTNQRITTDRDVNLNAVSPGFFATLGVRMVAGRDFDARDSRPVGETRLPRGDRQSVLCQAVSGGSQSARRAHLRGFGARRQAGHRSRRRGSGLQLSRYTRRVGAGVLSDFRGQRYGRQFLCEGPRDAGRRFRIDSSDHSAAPIRRCRSRTSGLWRNKSTVR